MEYSNEQITQEIKSMDNRLTEMEDKMTSIDAKLTQVVDAVVGNPLTGNGGFVKDMHMTELRLKELEKKQDKSDEFQKRIYWTITIIATIALVFQFIWNLWVSAKK